MKLTPFTELIEAGLSGGIDYALLHRAGLAACVDPPEVLDQLARQVAQQYAHGIITFNDADSIMNAAWGVAVSEEFWANHDQTIPPVMFEVYEAFDAGEYHHHGDAENVDSEVKYTKPLIERFLAGRENDA